MSKTPPNALVASPTAAPEGGPRPTPAAAPIPSVLNRRSRLPVALFARDGSGYVYAARERDRFFFTGVGAAAASVTTSDFDAGRVLRFCVGFALDWGSACTEAGVVGVAAGAGFSVALRPKPCSFAIAERCSEYAGAVRG